MLKDNKFWENFSGHIVNLKEFLTFQIEGTSCVNFIILSQYVWSYHKK